MPIVISAITGSYVANIFEPDTVKFTEPFTLHSFGNLITVKDRVLESLLNILETISTKYS